MPRTTSLIALLVLMVSVSKAQESSPYLCKEDLTVRGVDNAPLDARWATFAGTISSSDGVVGLFNKSDKKIAYYLLILQFEDASANYLFSVPLFNVDNDQRVVFDVPFRPWLMANWPGGHMAPIAPHSESHEAFGSPLIALTCPKVARISMIWLKFDDATEFKYVSAALTISVSSSAPIEISNKKAAKNWVPLTASGTVQVDPQGHVDVLDSDFNAVGFLEWLQQEIAAWKLTVPWSNGKTASARIPFLLVLGDTTDPRVQAEALRKRGIRGPMLLFYFGRAD